MTFRSILILSALLLSGPVFTQTVSYTHSLYLKDGSLLNGKLLEMNDDVVRFVLTDGSEVEMNRAAVWKVTEKQKGELIQPDGRKIQTMGWYSSISLHSLTSSRAGIDEREKRWGGGGHVSAGHRFNRMLGAGMGTGVDMNEIFFIPVYAELTGYLARDTGPKASHQKTASLRRLPFSYSLQLGYSFPVAEIFSEDDNFEQLKGGWMIYPAVGLLVPSRRGIAFRLDIGYKFQRYTRKYPIQPWWWEPQEISEKVTLKCFSLRAGWVF